MPFRLDPDRYGFRAKIQFTTAAWMPHRIYQACVKTGVVSNTVYVQHAVCEALARDLGMDLQELLDDLPRPRSRSMHLFDRPVPVQADQTGGRLMIGPANTVEEVR